MKHVFENKFVLTMNKEVKHKEAKYEVFEISLRDDLGRDGRLFKSEDGRIQFQ